MLLLSFSLHPQSDGIEARKHLLVHQMTNDDAPCGVSWQRQGTEREFIGIERNALCAERHVGTTESTLQSVGAIDQSAVAQMPSLVHRHGQRSVGISVRRRFAQCNAQFSFS